MKEKVVLAFSGGLDTSFCVKYLSNEKQLEVHSVIANTGGFSEKELEVIEKKAWQLGVKSHKTIEITTEYYDKCIKYLIYGNILRNQTYPLSVSSERSFQALAVINYAREIGANYVAHGSTGAGNDQVRFDLIFNVMAPGIEIITPIRDLKISRQEEIEYLKKQGVEADWKKMEYSINKGLWGTSIGGKETLTSKDPLPEEAFPSHVEKQEASTIKLSFEKGILKSLNDKPMDGPIEIIKKIDETASAYAIGRGMHIGDTIIGIKGRVGFEAPAPLIIIHAHQVLEKHALTKWQMHWKDQLANWYGMMLHEGLYLEPVMRNIEEFLISSQEKVNGDAFIRLEPYRFEVEGIESPNDLMDAGFASYGEMNESWTGEDVKGFTKIISNQLNIYNAINNGL